MSIDLAISIFVYPKACSVSISFLFLSIYLFINTRRRIVTNVMNNGKNMFIKAVAVSTSFWREIILKLISAGKMILTICMLLPSKLKSPLWIVEYPTSPNTLSKSPWT